MGECVLMEDFAHLLGTLVSNFDTDVCHIDGEDCCESIFLNLGAPIVQGT